MTRYLPLDRSVSMQLSSSLRLLVHDSTGLFGRSLAMIVLLGAAAACKPTPESLGYSSDEVPAEADSLYRLYVRLYTSEDPRSLMQPITCEEQRILERYGPQKSSRLSLIAGQAAEAEAGRAAVARIDELFHNTMIGGDSRLCTSVRDSSAIDSAQTTTRSKIGG